MHSKSQIPCQRSEYAKFKRADIRTLIRIIFAKLVDQTPVLLGRSAGRGFDCAGGLSLDLDEFAFGDALWGFRIQAGSAGGISALL